MADQKVSDLPSLNGADVDPADLLYIIDSSAGSAGSKKITVGQYQLAPVSGGTANGVVYLDGSKVVTTGSALTFDGTNLGVGTSSPSAKLEVASGKVLLSNGQSYAVKSSGGAVNDVIGLSAGNVLILGGGGATDSIQFWNQGLQRMTLDSSGNLGLGTTSPAARLDVGGNTADQLNAVFTTGTSDPNFRLGFVNGVAGGSGTSQGLIGLSYLGAGQAAVLDFIRGSTSTDASIAFRTNNAERARITSGGDLLVGTTTVAGAGGITLFNNVGPGFSVVNNNNAAATGHVFSSFRRSSVEIGSITQNGTTAVLFNTTSDRRLKDNITPAPSASDVIDAIEIVSHDWKSAPDEHVTYGVIAQDLALVAPQAVLQGDDGDEIGKTWGVDYSKLVPMLIKEIQSLRARVAALESA